MTRRRKHKPGVKTRFILWFLVLFMIWLSGMIVAAWILLPRPSPSDRPPRAVTRADLARELAGKTEARLKAPPLAGAGRMLSPQNPPPSSSGIVTLRWQGNSSTDLILAEKTINDFWAEASRIQVAVEYPEVSREGEKIRLRAEFESQILVELLLFVNEKKSRPPSGPRSLPPRVHSGKIAIVIDDIGNDLAALDRLLAIGVPITFAVLPFEPYTAESCERLDQARALILLHMPMEPESYPENHPGEGSLLTGMTPGDIARKVELALEKVPEARGVNNHMGSAFTADKSGMEAFLSVLKRRGLFFVDSRTSMNTVGRTLAEQLGVRSAERKVFLDHELAPAYIKGQLMELSELADREGAAIGIGHPHPETVAVLVEMLPEMARAGYHFVYVSEVVK